MVHHSSVVYRGLPTISIDTNVAVQGPVHSYKWGLFRSPDSIPDDRFLFKSVLIHVRLDDSVKSAPIVVADLKEPERLQSAGNRNQQFCCPENQASFRPEHQLNNGTLIERAGQANQSASNGNHLQFSMHLLSVSQAKNRRGGT